jgi:3-oxoacyl-[acyl-carrier-protein] synthase II
MRRVAVTGIGLLTPLGVGVEPTWDGLLAGRSAVAPVTSLDVSSLSTRIGAELTGFAPEDFISNRRSLRMMTTSDRYSFSGATLALRDAGLDMEAENGDRVALYVGGSKEVPDLMHLSVPALAASNPDGSVDLRRFGESAFSEAYPLFFVEGLPAGSLFYISQAYGITGPGCYFAGMEEASATALGVAYRAVLRGEVDLAIAGGFDDGVGWWNLARLDAMGVLTPRNDLGAAACRPYDRDRTGTVAGDGAAYLVLEDLDRARARGARVYATVTGFASGLDNSGLLTPDPAGGALVRSLQAARREAGRSPAEVAYAATHGSGTLLGDASEARALRTAFGPAADQLAASSVKPATGHLLAAAGALNAAVAVLAIYHQAVPPTLNLDSVDPDCALDWIPGQARDLAVSTAIAIARGFEGQSAVLIFEKAG